uniref:Uncharacterized protein n=1 Tax=viral metagenome TaxID=1070528 RepID=A0A6M3IRZ4_9ZZZZ
MAECRWTGATNGKFLTENGNWSGNAPVTGDTVVVPADATQDIDDELNASAVDLEGFTVEEGCTITIGTTSADLQISLKNVTYFDANLGGTGRTFLDVDDYDQINITAAAASPGAGQYGLTLVGTHDADDTSNRGTINVYADTNQSIGIGAELGTDMEVNKLVVVGGDVTVGSSVTEYDDAAAPDIEIYGGDVTTKCPVGTVTKNAGNWTHESGAATAYYGQAGTTYYNSSGTLTNGYGSGNDLFTMEDNIDGATISNYQLKRGGGFRDPYKKATLTNGIDLDRCKIEDVTLDLGNHITVTPSAV